LQFGGGKRGPVFRKTGGGPIAEKSVTCMGRRNTRAKVALGQKGEVEGCGRGGETMREKGKTVQGWGNKILPH